MTATWILLWVLLAIGLLIAVAVFVEAYQALRDRW